MFDMLNKEKKSLLSSFFLFSFLTAGQIYLGESPFFILIFFLVSVSIFLYFACRRSGGLLASYAVISVLLLYILLTVSMSPIAPGHAVVILISPILCAIYIGLKDIKLNWKLLSFSFLIAFLISAIVSWIQYLESFDRVAGTIIDPNNFAAIMYVSSLLLLSFHRTNLITVALQFLFLFAMFATFSRSGIAAWVLAVIGYGIAILRLAPERKNQLASYLLIALVAYAAVKIVPLLFGYESVSRHFQDMHNLNARWPMWVSTWELIKEAPWLGHGFGSFAVLYPSVRTEFASAGLVAHNDYLQLWLEGGILVFGLFVSWMLFHLRLLFRLLILKQGAGDKRKIELALLLIINLALFSQATFNFVFYNLYLNITAWLLFGRIYWLAMRSGLIRLLKRSKYNRALGALTSVVLLLFTGNLMLVESANAIYGSYENKPQYFQKLAQDQELLAWYLRVDPDNTQASEVYIKKLLAAIPGLEPKQREKAFELAWEQISRMQERYPSLPRFHVLAGDLLAEAKRHKIAEVSANLAVGHWLQALEVHPGYIPAHLRVSQYIESEKGKQAALDYLLGKQLIWLNITSWPKAEVYWLEAQRLAEAVDPEKAEKIDILIHQSREKIKALSPLRRYYKG
ncbi:O-antigen ligase family protein [Parendozoicomonas haliclonae]|uniref:O-Antigen ligase n=1 Tax=Parendozoicomonas haliclonae TaxID=1960125 RepID=A0A1X7ADW4_9GAMM|nr:O-antigen ligase family protein [Parendozoicomonas haliclonae]SMA31784.1 O-Antigen ligase [Parendozoicomonas haliclonae]